MTYTAEISRTNPTFFLYVIDQSGSMADQWGSQEAEVSRTKADELADITNRLLQNLIIRCAKAEGVRDYFHIGVIGYGAVVGPAFTGSLTSKELVPISEVADNPARIEERSKKVTDGAGGLVDETVKFPIWFDPTANGGTPMCQAMTEAQRILSSWLSQYPDCFPPVLFHITDGESTDGDPTSVMSDIKGLSSSDGNVILFNIHLSSNPSAKIIEYPTSSEGLPDQYAQLLFNTAGFLTGNMINVARDDFKLNVSDQSKAFVLNADARAVITALDIGTRPGSLR